MVIFLMFLSTHYSTTTSHFLKVLILRNLWRRRSKILRDKHLLKPLSCSVPVKLDRIPMSALNHLLRVWVLRYDKTKELESHKAWHIIHSWRIYHPHNVRTRYLHTEGQGLILMRGKRLLKPSSLFAKPLDGLDAMLILEDLGVYLISHKPVTIKEKRYWSQEQMGLERNLKLHRLLESMILLELI